MTWRRIPSVLLVLLLLPLVGVSAARDETSVGFFDVEAGEFQGSAKLELRVDLTQGMLGRYRAEGIQLELKVHRIADGLVSKVSTIDGLTLSALHVRDVEGAFVDELEWSVNEAAWDTRNVLGLLGMDGAESEAAVITAYDAMARAVYENTERLGDRQFRYILSYHASIVRSAFRLVREPDRWPDGKPCNAAIDYMEQGAPFSCIEDWEIDQDPDLLLPCLILDGSDICCCGNYSGPCWFCHILCCAHDLACWCCEPAWACGPDCVPEDGCSGSVYQNHVQEAPSTEQVRPVN